MSLTIKDFNLINEWEVTEPNNLWKDNVDIAKANPAWNPAQWNWNDQPVYITDKSTGKKYLNLPPEFIKTSHGKVLRQTFLKGLLDTLIRIVKLITFAHFWLPKQKGFSTLKERAAFALFDLKRVLITPLAAVGITAAALYGMARPNDGRKLCTSIASLVPRMNDDNDRFPEFPTFTPETAKL